MFSRNLKAIEILNTELRVFVSTKNSKGKTEISVVRGSEARNKNQGEMLFNETFDSPNVESDDVVEICRAADVTVESLNAALAE